MTGKPDLMRAYGNWMAPALEPTDDHGLEERTKIRIVRDFLCVLVLPSYTKNKHIEYLLSSFVFVVEEFA